LRGSRTRTTQRDSERQRAREAVHLMVAKPDGADCPETDRAARRRLEITLTRTRGASASKRFANYGRKLQNTVQM
jgi:hypothetical protein